MLGTFALNALNAGKLLGILPQTRAVTIRDRFLAVADPVQKDGATAENFFDNAIILGDSQGLLVTFLVGGQPRAFIIIADDVLLGRASTVRITNNTRAPESLQGVLVRELTHARNLDNTEALRAIADTDAHSYADTALADRLSASTRNQTAAVLCSFVSEMTARHVHWVILKELAGTPATVALNALPADKLAAAALLYFVELGSIYGCNGYGAGINSQGEAVRFRQLSLWLRLCAAQSFSDIGAQNAQSKQAFQAAAQFCAAQVANPTLGLTHQDGVFPLIQDFH
jgi:hypothetical protein